MHAFSLTRFRALFSVTIAVVTAFTLSACNVASSMKFKALSFSSTSITIDSPADGATIGSKSVRPLPFNGTCAYNLQPVNLTVGKATASATCKDGSWSTTVEISSMADGVIDVLATHSDTSGSQSTAKTTFQKRFAPPTVSFVLPPSGTWINLVNESNFQIGGNCSNATVPVEVSSNAINSVVETTCTNGSWFTSMDLTGAPNGMGTVLLTVSQTDALGQQGTATLLLNKKASAPQVKFGFGAAPLSPAPNSVVGTLITLGGSCDSTGSPVSINFPPLTTPNFGSSANPTTCASGTFSVSVDISSLPDGLFTVSASQTDVAQNPGSDTLQLSKDTTPPQLAITNLVNNAYVKGSFSVLGTCLTSNNSLTVMLDSTVVQSGLSCVGGTFSANLTATQGTHSVTVKEVKASNNTSNTQTITGLHVLTAIPVLTETSHPTTYTDNQLTTSFVGSCSQPVTVTVGPTGTPSTITCNGATNTTPGTWSYPYAPSNDGTYQFTFNSSDQAGNAAASVIRSWTRITQAPVLTFTGPSASTLVTSNATLAGTCNPGLQVSLLEGANFASATLLAKTTCSVSGNGGVFSQAVTNLTGTNGSTITVWATQTDQASNVGKTSLSLNFDNSMPTIAFNPVTTYVNSLNQKTYSGIAGTCGNGPSVTLTVVGNAAFAPVTVPCSSGGFTFTSLDFQTPGVQDGNFTVQGKITTLAGNSQTATATVGKATSVPIITFSLPIASMNGTTAKSFVISGSCVEANPSVIPGVNLMTGKNITIGGAISDMIQCNNGTFSKTYDFTSPTYSSIPDGQVNFTANFADLAGNPAAQISTNVTKNTTPPPFALNPLTQTIGANASPTVAVTNCLLGSSISIKGPGAGKPTTDTSFSASFQCQSPVPPLPIQTSDGTYSYTFTETDSTSGNSNAITIAATRNTAAPTLNFTVVPTSPSITSGANGSTTSFSASGAASGAGTAITFSGSCLANATISVTDNGTPTTATCTSSGTWSYTSTAQTSDNSAFNPYVYVFNESDTIGNKSTLTANWIRITQPPTINFTAPMVGVATLAAAQAMTPYNVTQKTTPTSVTITCSAGATLTLSAINGSNVAGALASPSVTSATCSSSTSVTYTFSGSDDLFILSATAKNAAGLSATAYLAVNVSTVPPVFTLKTPVVANAGQTTSTILVTSNGLFTGSFAANNLAITGTCGGLNLPITFSYAAAGYSDSSTICTSGGTFSANLDISAIPDNGLLSFILLATHKSSSGLASTINVAITKAATPPVVTIIPQPTKSVTFNATGAMQSFNPPANVNEIIVTVNGAGGGAGGNAPGVGGAGGLAKAIVYKDPVLGWGQLDLLVGTGGQTVNGGGGGGGRSAVSMFGAEIVVAGGGGGGTSGGTGAAGGAGGGQIGQSGNCYNMNAPTSIVPIINGGSTTASSGGLFNWNGFDKQSGFGNYCPYNQPGSGTGPSASGNGTTALGGAGSGYPSVTSGVAFGGGGVASTLNGCGAGGAGGGGYYGGAGGPALYYEFPAGGGHAVTCGGGGGSSYFKPSRTTMLLDTRGGGAAGGVGAGASGANGSITISWETSTTSTMSAVPIGGTCSVPNKPVTVTGPASTNPINIICQSNNTWSATANLPAAPGANSIVYASQTDAYKNTSAIVSLGIPREMVVVITTIGGPNTWTIPNGVSTVTVRAWGAAGNPGQGVGGAGGFVSGTIDVSNYTSLIVIVGGSGSMSASGGGGGGGLSGIFGGNFIPGSLTSQNNAIMIAAGGGGGGTGGRAGGAGGPSGQAGAGTGWGPGGGGATVSGPGLGGSGNTAGQNGGILKGGGTGPEGGWAGGGGADWGAGLASAGGGAGYFGGGTASSGNNGSTGCGGGGGGSNFLSTVVMNGQNLGSTGSTPPQTTDPDYSAGYGDGSKPGGQGLVLISY